MLLTTSTHNPLTTENINRIWREVFRPAYDETETHRAITSHFGRHRFTTYWRVGQDVNRALVKYMRGDRQADLPTHGADSIDAYIHTYYEDIEPVYRQQMFQLLE
jgi:integrase/recombinase XerD